jgi:hypothetical protein
VTSTAHAKRGRPTKFGRPSRVAALTLPDEVIRGLRKINSDLAWAIVSLFEKTPHWPPPARHDHQPDTELVKIAGRRHLIVVNRAVFRSLPGISIVPINATHAFLALEPGRGMADLELSVIDRLDKAASPREQRALAALRSQLSAWRHDRSLRFHARSIIVVERVAGGTAARAANKPGHG